MPAHVWPAFAKLPHRQPEIAFARFASAHTTCASLPPSSSTEPFRRSAQAVPTCRPTSTEPVKKILDALDSTSALPTAPPPCTVRTRPSGRPPRSKTSLIRSPISGVSELVDLVEDRLRRAQHVARAAGERQLRPERLDRRDVVDDRLDVAGVEGGDRADQLARERAVRLDGPSVRALGFRAFRSCGGS